MSSQKCTIIQFVSGPIGVYRGDVIGKGKSQLRHGQGVWIGTAGEQKGDMYQGTWDQGRRTGHGSYSWRDGDTYEGEFVDDRMHGHGVRTFADGDRFEGEFCHDKMHGRGVIRSCDGKRIFDGKWAMDFPLKGTALDEDRGIYSAKFDGKTLFDSAWQPPSIPHEWTRWGTLQEGWPVQTLEWTGKVLRVDGTSFEGQLLWLRSISGIETDLNGSRYAVTYKGSRTLAEKQQPETKQREVCLVSLRSNNKKQQRAMKNLSHL